MNTEAGNAFMRLVGIMDDLREKCPWDRKQTIQSLRQMTIEETYELADAITDTDWDGIREELGDLMLHILFYSKIGMEKSKFTLKEVINGICEKLITRHPHIYGNRDDPESPVIVHSDEDVKRNWEKIKLKEGKQSVLSGVPISLPALVKAMRLQEKAKQVGFEWENKEQVWEKVEEEIRELKHAIENSASSKAESSPSIEKVEEETGDLIFSIVNYARFLRVDAENALERTNKKFIRRFTQMEQQALKDGRDIHQLTLQEMDAIWNTIKQKEQ